MQREKKKLVTKRNNKRFHKCKIWLLEEIGERSSSNTPHRLRNMTPVMGGITCFIPGHTAKNVAVMINRQNTVTKIIYP